MIARLTKELVHKEAAIATREAENARLSAIIKKLQRSQFGKSSEKLTPDQLRGAIILAHCGSRPTADALPRILDRFAEMGFEVKKLSEVLQG